MLKFNPTDLNKGLKLNQENTVKIARLAGFGENTPSFKEDKCILLVSVGSDYFENEELIAQIKLIKEKFAECVILLGDTLQRFNIAFENSHTQTFTMEEAERKAKERGNKWISDYAQAIESIFNLHIRYQIQKWDQWRLDGNFSKAKSRVENLLESNNEYQASLLTTIDEYAQRTKNRLNKETYNLIEKNHLAFCKQYLIEEAAVLILLAQNGYKNALYPAKQTSFLSKTFELLIRKEDNTIFNWIPIRFKSQTKDNVDHQFFKKKKEKSNENVMGKENIDIYAQIAFNQINCFLSQLNSNTEKEYFLEVLVEKIYEKSNKNFKQTSVMEYT